MWTKSGFGANVRGFPDPHLEGAHFQDEVVDVDQQEHPGVLRPNVVPVHGAAAFSGRVLAVFAAGSLEEDLLEGETSGRAVLIGPMGELQEFLQHEFAQALGSAGAGKAAELDVLDAAHHAPGRSVDREGAEEILGAVRKPVLLLEVQRKQLNLVSPLAAPALELKPVPDGLLGFLDQEAIVLGEGLRGRFGCGRFVNRHSSSEPVWKNSHYELLT